MKKDLFKTLILLIILVVCLNALEATYASEYSNFNDVNQANYPKWTLTINGLVNQTLNLTLNDVVAMSETTVNANLYCFSDLISGGNWFGVRLGVILEKAEVNGEAKYIQLLASDGYSTLLDISTAMQEDIIIAYQLNGQPLPEFLRLVLPKENGSEWIALITQITAISDPKSRSEKPNSQPTMFHEAAKSLSSKSSGEFTISNSELNMPPFISMPKELDNSTTNQQDLLTSNSQIETNHLLLVIMLEMLIIGMGYAYSRHGSHKNHKKL